jgi:hypothetical protein
MTSQTGFDIAVISTAAVAVGWYGRSLRGSHHELQSTIRKISGIRSSRSNQAVTVTLICAFLALMLYELVVKHR